MDQHMDPKIKLPQDMLDKESYSNLPTNDKAAYAEKLIERVLDLNTDMGITVTQTAEATHADRKAIAKYLEKLVAKRIAYKVIQGNSIRYFKNGRLIHHLFNKDLALSDRDISFKALFDGRQVLVFIQEKRKNPLGEVEDGGGILIPMKDIDTFVNQAVKIMSEIPKIKKEFIKLIE
jgi:hypothetical protein